MTHHEFYQGLRIEVRKEGDKWVVFLDGREDASYGTKREAMAYIRLCIKVR